MKPPIIDLEAWSPSLNDWKLKRDSFREGLRNRLGHLPMLPREIHATCQREEAHGVGVAEKIVIDNGREMGIPAWFITPRNEEHPGPAVLWLHWHGGEYGVGKQEVFEDLHTPSSPAQTFLQMGWSILCMDAFGFGERNGRDPESGGDFDQEGEHTLAKHFLWQGSSLFGQMLWEDRLALRYLKQRPEVRGQPIFVAGVSMGATRSQWLLALEDVLAGAVSLACAVRYRDLLAQQGLHRHGMYFYVPGMMEYCDLELILALGAPRPHLLINGASDPLSPRAGIDRAVGLARTVYALHGKEENLKSQLFDKVGHQVQEDMWNEMKRWCVSVQKAHLQPDGL